MLAGWRAGRGISLHSKPTRLLHGSQELLIELLIRLVRRDVDAVEAGEKNWNNIYLKTTTSVKASSFKC